MGRLIVALAIIVAAGACSSDPAPDPTGQLANPASVYCEQQGGTVDIRTDSGGNQSGVCVFTDGTEVEEWAFYRGEADPRFP
jgi:putative hemolysin